MLCTGEQSFFFPQDLSFEEAFRILDGVAPLPDGTLEDYIQNVTNINSSYLDNTQADIDELIETSIGFNNTEVNGVVSISPSLFPPLKSNNLHGETVFICFW